MVNQSVNLGQVNDPEGSRNNNKDTGSPKVKFRTKSSYKNTGTFSPNDETKRSINIKTNMSFKKNFSVKREKYNRSTNIGYTRVSPKSNK